MAKKNSGKLKGRVTVPLSTLQTIYEAGRKQRPLQIKLRTKRTK